jgi:hypothetical protein
MSTVAVMWDEPVVQPAPPQTERSRFAFGLADDEGDVMGYTEAKWQILTRTREEPPIAVSKAAGADDATLDSPSWFSSRMAVLRERRFERTNDPRRRRSRIPL